MIEITPYLNPQSKDPLYIQLSAYLKQAILKGHLKPKERLPAKRALAAHLKISLNTVQAAYDQLQAEGYVEGIERKGYYVNVLDDAVHTSHKPIQQTLIKPRQQQSYNIDFNSGQVDTEHFPLRMWRKRMTDVLNTGERLLQTGDPQGELGLRTMIADYLYAARGVHCSAEQIVIGAGTQVLMGLLSLLIGKEETYAIENPGYHRVKTVWRDQGIKYVPIPLDSAGISVAKLRMTNANVAYVTPSHQFPYGMVMPVARRLALLKWAAEIDGYIIEDDYDGEYRYKGKPIPALQGLDTNDRVFYLGTFSKAMIPSMRLSYIVMPLAFLDRYHEHLTIYKQTVSRLHQETLFQFMKQGHWQRHLNKMRTLYRKKHKILLESIQQFMPQQVAIIGESAGLHLILSVQNGLSEKTLIELAAQQGIKVYPTSLYEEGIKAKQHAEILLGFGGLSESEIQIGIQLLAEGWGCNK